MVWAIGSQDEREALEDFREAFDIELPILWDEGGAVHADYELDLPFPIGAYPQQWLIGADGTVRYVNNRYEADRLVEAIEAELRRSR